MTNCGGCARFMTATDGVSCTTCTRLFHQVCLGVAQEVAKQPNWSCPYCLKKKPMDNRCETPVKGTCQDLGDNVGVCANVVDEPMKTTATDTTIGLEQVDLGLEIRLFREQVCSMQEEIKMLRQDVQELRNTLVCNTTRLNAIEGRVDLVEQRLDSKQDSAGRLQTVIEELKAELNDRDQQLLSNDIEISNVPEDSGEQPGHIVSLIAVKIGVALDDKDIVYAERVGQKKMQGSHTDRPRPLVVRLARRSTRDDLLRSMRVRRGANTADFGLASESRPFYINERLTKYNRQLLFRVREARKKHEWKFVWTKRGRILVKQDEGKPTFAIRTETDISSVFGIGPVQLTE